SFNSSLGFQDAVQAGVVVQSDGKIVIAGGNGGIGRHYNLGAFDLARFNTDGSLDTSFGSKGVVVTSLPQFETVHAKTLLLQPDRKLIAVGDAGDFLQPQDWLLARYNTNGSLDTSFGSKGIVTTAATSGLGGAVLYPNTGTANDGQIAIAGYNAALSSGP